MTREAMELKVTAPGLEAALRRSEQTILRRVRPEVRRSVGLITREARGEAPKAGSELAQSIDSRLAPSGLAAVIAPSVDYAGYVELGTGIYGPEGEASGKVSLRMVENLEDWISRGSAIEPNDVGMSHSRLAWAIARSIAKTGTKPHPFMRPAYEAQGPKAERRIQAEIEKGVTEVLQ